MKTFEFSEVTVARRIRKRTPWRLDDLKGCRPEGHPSLRRGCRGKVLLEAGQVWVENGSDKLWVIKHLEDGRHPGAFSHRVWLRPYRSRGRRYWEMSEGELRTHARVWEESLSSRAEIFEKLKNSRAAEWEGIFDSDEAAFSFFGLDPKTGNRID